MNQTALVLGGSGVVGNELVKTLMETNQYDKVHLLLRRPIGIKNSKCEQHLIDFDALEQYSDLFKVTDVYCCLGTTIKKAKNKEAFRIVDYGYPVTAAKLAKENGAEKFLVISAMGANPRSLFFYNQVKGQLEESLAIIHLPAVHIFRPSLLLGEREEFRFGEKIAAKASRFFNAIMVGPLRPYKAIEASKVAAAMTVAAASSKKGVNIYSSDEIERLAES